MDFSVRGAGHQPAAAAQPSSVNDGPAKHNMNHRPGGVGSFFRFAVVVLLFCITVLMLATISLLHYDNGNNTKYVNTGDFQAVDVNVGGSSSGDQIYFGHITNVDSQSLVLNDVYYIPTTSNSTNITLEPLVCQIDAPIDQMVVSRSSVNWWENLQSGGKVAKTIITYQKDNPKITCPQTSTSSTSSSSSTATGSATTPK